MSEGHPTSSLGISCRGCTRRSKPLPDIKCRERGPQAWAYYSTAKMVTTSEGTHRLPDGTELYTKSWEVSRTHHPASFSPPPPGLSPPRGKHKRSNSHKTAFSNSFRNPHLYPRLQRSLQPLRGLSPNSSLTRHPRPCLRPAWMGPFCSETLRPRPHRPYKHSPRRYHFVHFSASALSYTVVLDGCFHGRSSGVTICG